MNAFVSSCKSRFLIKNTYSQQKNVFMSPITGINKNLGPHRDCFSCKTIFRRVGFNIGDPDKHHGKELTACRNGTAKFWYTKKFLRAIPTSDFGVVLNCSLIIRMRASEQELTGCWSSIFAQATGVRARRAAPRPRPPRSSGPPQSSPRSPSARAPRSSR